MTPVERGAAPDDPAVPGNPQGPPPLVRVIGFPAPGGLVDLELWVGDAVCLSGPNGVGKTSLLRAIAGLAAPLGPKEVRVDGVDPRSVPAPRLPALCDLLCQEALDGLVGLTVEGEFRVRGRVPEAMGSLRDRDVATLSAGEARRVTLAVAKAGQAPVLLLDEPAEGLDAEGRDRLRDLVRTVRARGAVVFVDPDGTLSKEASRTVELGSVGRRVAPMRFGPVRPRGPGGPNGDVRVQAEAVTVERAGRLVPLPALALGSGVHVLRGRNGGGKSTLLRRLAGLGAGPAGAPGTPFLPQRARDLLMEDRVKECLVDAQEDVVSVLVPSDLLERHPWTLSGGEAQRVALASVLGRPGDVVLLDEPDAHLDGAGYNALCAVLRQRAKRGTVIVVATHDEGLRQAASSVVEVGA